MSIVRCPRNGAERLSRESPVREDAAQPAPVHGLILVHGSTSTDGWAAWRPSTSRVSPHFRLEEEFTGLGSPGDEFPDTSPPRRVPGHEPPATSSRRQCQRKLLPRHGLSRSSSTEDGFSGTPSSESGSSESGPSGAAPRVRLSSEARTSRDTLQRAPELTCGRLRCPMATTTPPSAIRGRCGCHRRRRRSSCASEISDSSSAPSCRDRGPR